MIKAFAVRRRGSKEISAHIYSTRSDARAALSRYLFLIDNEEGLSAWEIVRVEITVKGEAH